MSAFVAGFGAGFALSAYLNLKNLRKEVTGSGDLTIDPPSEGEEVAQLKQEILSLQLENAGLKADRDGWQQQAKAAKEALLAAAKADPSLVVTEGDRVGFSHPDDPKPPEEGGEG